MKKTKTKKITNGIYVSGAVWGLMLAMTAAAVFLFITATVPATASPQPQPRVGEVEITVSARAAAFISETITTPFPVHMVGVAWQGELVEPIAIRAGRDGAWSEWFAAESTSEVVRNGWQYATDPILLQETDQLQFRVADTSVTRVKLVYVQIGEANESWFPNWFTSLFYGANAASPATVQPRSAWGADESYRYNGGEELWPAEYREPKLFVVHHTAGDAGVNNATAVIRGIYYWHAVALGWGDIGYNYIVAQDGTIYEGRAGGLGVVGAHTHRDAACAKARFGNAEAINFNYGTVGIAVLGDYENTSLAVNASVKNGLQSLIGTFGRELGLAPSGTNYLGDATYPAVVGHRDLDCSDCPGDTLYGQLGTIQAAAQTYYDALPAPTLTVKAAYVRQSEQPVTINTGESKEVWVEFRNTGSTSWYSYQSPSLAIKPLGGVVMADGSSAPVASLETAVVAPGEVGRFSFTVTAPSDTLEAAQQFALAVGDQTVSNASFTLKIAVTGYEMAGAVEDISLVPAVFVSSRQSVTVRVKNRGTQTWQRGDVTLDMFDLGDHRSVFYDAGWPSEQGSVQFAEAEVPQNGTATFTFTAVAPNRPGHFINYYVLNDRDGNLVQTSKYSITRVDAKFNGQFISHTMAPATRPGWRPAVTVTMKNTGPFTWDRHVTLEARDLGGRVSRFRDSSWLSGTSVTRLNEASVAPGQTGTFTFRMLAPREAGFFRNDLVLTRLGEIVAGTDYALLTRVDP